MVFVRGFDFCLFYFVARRDRQAFLGGKKRLKEPLGNMSSNPSLCLH